MTILTGFLILFRLSATQFKDTIYILGMDKEKHGEPAYPKSAWMEAWEDFSSNNTVGKWCI